MVVQNQTAKATIVLRPKEDLGLKSFRDLYQVLGIRTVFCVLFSFLVGLREELCCWDAYQIEVCSTPVAGELSSE